MTKLLTAIFTIPADEKDPVVRFGLKVAQVCLVIEILVVLFLGCRAAFLTIKFIHLLLHAYP